MNAAQRPGTIPSRNDTVIAAVLAELLTGTPIRSVDAVRAAGTIRLASTVFDLRRKYGWPIKSQDVATDCVDGRTASVSEYSLPAEVIAAAAERGDRAWAAKVRAAREALLARKGLS